MTRLDRISERLNLEEVQVKALLDVTKAINNNLSTTELLQLYESIMRDQLGITRLMLYKRAQGWQYILSFGTTTKEEDGKLIITARRERLSSAADHGNQNYTSARLYTKGKASWTYGRWEIRAKLPCALGTWPAIWMLGDGIPDTGVWPLDGEIDIVEQKGFDAGEKTRVLGTVHMQAYPGGNSKGKTVSLPAACTDFNVYQMEWDESRIQIGVNGTHYFTYTNPKNGNVNEWPFFKPQHLPLNVAVGGVLGGTVRDDQLPASMEIDYVRVYQR